ncbi:hypothetical protein IL306_001205 [Fusarium sp. DS 682]|nr:hypothetical protein IL306_001205 [Fusarium sp. DS 682]
MENSHERSPAPSPPSLSHPHPRPHPKLPRKITPPERKPLPSPPASGERNRATPTADELPQTLIEFKRRVETGDVSPLTSFHLGAKDYEHYHDKLEATFRRFDYEPRHQRITFRMPSKTHETFAHSIADAIYNKVSELGRGSEELRAFISKIKKSGSSDVFLQDANSGTKKRRRRQPDGQFHFVNAALPNVVIEVAYSQDGKDLSKAAKEYLRYTEGNIEVVLCFDLNSTTESTLSVWKPAFTPIDNSDEYNLVYDQVVQSQPFRTADKNPINLDHELVLDLHDFAPDQFCDNIPNPNISIPYSKLYELLCEAETLEQSVTTGVRSRRRLKRERVSSSSLEDMADEDKQRLSDEVDAAMKKQSADDKAYKGANDRSRSAKRHTQEVRKYTLS